MFNIPTDRIFLGIQNFQETPNLWVTFSILTDGYFPRQGPYFFLHRRAVQQIRGLSVGDFFSVLVGELESIT